MDVKKPIPLEVVAVKVPPGVFRTPRVVVALRCGVVVLRVMVRRLSGSRLNVSAPMAADGAAGVEMPAALWADVERAALAAVAADADAVEALLAGGRKRGRWRHAAPEKRDDLDGEP